MGGARVHEMPSLACRDGGNLGSDDVRDGRIVENPSEPLFCRLNACYGKSRLAVGHVSPEGERCFLPYGLNEVFIGSSPWQGRAPQWTSAFVVLRISVREWPRTLAEARLLLGKNDHSPA